MTAPATPPDPAASRQPMTRREARAARERAERERRPQAQPESQTTEPQPQPDEPAQRLRPVDTAPEQQVQPAEPEPAEHEPAEEQHHDHLGLRWHAAPPDDGEPPRRRRGGARRAWTWIITAVVILALVGGGGLFAWNTFQPQVQAVLKHFDKTPTDYTGEGTGKVQVTIKSGDTGASIAKTLATSGVTRTSTAFYQLLLETKPDPVFQPGVYQLRKHMSAKAALAALQDPKNRLERTLLIREGESENTVLQDAATATGIPLDQLQSAAANPAAFGLPSQAKTLEGFLFPATYTFDPGVDANGVLTTLVDRAKQAFQDDGIPDDKLWDTVILASIVQKEAGPNPQDLPKIAGVFTNRLNKGMLLQSDATVAYGTGHTDTVWTTDAERKDASNPYNTYVHTGLPAGPIGNPGDAALQAAMHPEGDYLYFTVVNLQTGETAFATTEAEHEANVEKLQQWCAQADNKAYCS